MDKINKLIAMLDAIDNSYITKYELSEWEDPSDIDYWMYVTKHPNSDDIEELACELFITGGGIPCLENIQMFNNHSNGRYYVAPGERDSFGWLTGVIVRRSDRVLMHVFG